MTLRLFLMVAGVALLGAAVYFFTQAGDGNSMQFRNMVLSGIMGMVCLVTSMALGTTPTIEHTNEYHTEV